VNASKQPKGMPMNTTIRRAAVLWFGLALAGCQPLDLKPSGSLFSGRDDRAGTPAALTAVWSNAVLQRADGTHARGFGGRLMFYGKKHQSPIRVDGTLVVYAFDEKDRHPDDPRPDRKYVFTRAQFASHYSKSDLGHSYSIWIPWDNVDGDLKEVSLMARFTSVDGEAIVGEQVKLTLPGRTGDPIAQGPIHPAAGEGPQRLPTVEPASHQSPADPGDRRMATATIAVPPRVGSR
jgi:hypothetical protein